MRRITTIILLFLFFTTILTFSQENSTPNVNLHLAVLQGNLDAVKQHIKAGTDLNEKDQFGSTPLIIAVTFGKNDIVKELIKAGADINVTNNEGSTPLHIAAFFARPEIVKSLLDNGADKYLRNIAGSTAYDIVAAPFEYDKELYDKLSAGLKPLGLVLDYEKIKKLRPQIAEMLRPKKEELKGIKYIPVEREDWKISTPEEQGIDPILVAELYNDTSHMDKLYSLLVIKNGYLIAEKYFNGASIDQLSSRASVTKSITSALLGTAMHQGYIKSVDQKMIDFFPEVADKITDARKESITIKEMLQMRAGYPWEETDSTYWNALWTGKYIDKIVQLPLTIDPGTGFQYSNMTSNWLGIIIAGTTNADLKTFGEKYLFSPLDIKIGNWKKDWDGNYIGAADLEITARDMAKFGLLYLNKGKFEGKQIVLESWVKKSLQKYSDDINSGGIESSRVARYFYDIGYGYQWWSAKAGNHSFNLAWGHGGQFIILLHDLNMIIVVTSDPFWGKEKHFDAWQYEKANMNLVGKFIKLLPDN
jgi:CubicO group peptidase (beta-lactamase class C family)